MTRSPLLVVPALVALALAVPAPANAGEPGAVPLWQAAGDGLVTVKVREVSGYTQVVLEIANVSTGTLAIDVNGSYLVPVKRRRGRPRDAAARARSPRGGRPPEGPLRRLDRGGRPRAVRGPHGLHEPWRIVTVGLDALPARAHLGPRGDAARGPRRLEDEPPGEPERRPGHRVGGGPPRPARAQWRGESRAGRRARRPRRRSPSPPWTSPTARGGSRSWEATSTR